MRYPHIAQRVFNCPLMIARVKLETILGAIGPRLVLGVESAVSGDKRSRRLLISPPKGLPSCRSPARLSGGHRVYRPSRV